MSIDKQELETRFTYHPPKDRQPEIYKSIRNKAHQFAIDLVVFCPQSRELSLAITKLEECVFYANAAIARRSE